MHSAHVLSFGDRMHDSPGMYPSRLLLLPHDPAWANWFAAESARMRCALVDTALAVEHIGSTAVPELLAKPIIDIAVIVANIDDFERSIEPLSRLGYRHRGQHGEDALRRYFVLEREGRRVAQLHMWAAQSAAWRVALAFRDLLRSRADLRAAYAAEKVRLAEAVSGDKRAYAARKEPFVTALLESAGLLPQGLQ